MNYTGRVGRRQGMNYTGGKRGSGNNINTLLMYEILKKYFIKPLIYLFAHFHLEL